MCLLELSTMEYPYAECKNAAQIYRKVSLVSSTESEGWWWWWGGGKGRGESRMDGRENAGRMEGRADGALYVAARPPVAAPAAHRASPLLPS